MPHWDALPEASARVSFCANATCSAQVAGGRSGSRPASLNRSLFQYKTIVERWKGTPQVLPAVWLLSMKAGKKLFSQVLSSSDLLKSSMGTTASSSISVNISVDNNTEVVGGLPLLCAVKALTMVSW